MKAMSDGELLGSDAQTYTNGAASGGLSPVMTKEETQAREKDMKATSSGSDSDRKIKQALRGPLNRRRRNGETAAVCARHWNVCSVMVNSGLRGHHTMARGGGNLGLRTETLSIG